MPLTSELTVAGVLLLKHAGVDGYHYYRGTLHGQPVTFRPTLSRTGSPLGWRAYENIETADQSCVATAETLTLAVQRAAYTLGQRAERRTTP